MSLLESVDSKIRPIFMTAPYAFFTEHDLHTELSHIIDRNLQEDGGLYAYTRDGKKVKLVHHEYPTPFRCYMGDGDFIRVTEREFNERRTSLTGGEKKRVNISRGHLDLVVFNREYVETNDFITVTGKDYRAILQSFNVIQPSALNLALEVTYFLNDSDRLRAGVLDNTVKAVKQDYKKLIELQSFMVGDEPFCKRAGLMFFANTSFREELEEKMNGIDRDSSVSLLTYYS